MTDLNEWLAAVTLTPHADLHTAVWLLAEARWQRDVAADKDRSRDRRWNGWWLLAEARWVAEDCAADFNARSGGWDHWPAFPWETP